MLAKIADPADNAVSRKSYAIRRGLSMREEMATAFRVGQSHYSAFAQLRNPSTERTRVFIRDFLREAFGFDDLELSDGPVSFIAGKRAPIVVVSPTGEKLDRRCEALSTDRPLSPALALQNYLNKHDDALWGLVSNGHVIWLMRDNASLTRPAYIEADIAQIFTNEDFASFCALWLLNHRTRFGAKGALATDCELENCRNKGAHEGEVARDRLAGQVKQALEILGSGFLEANTEFAASLKSGEIKMTDWFNQLLYFIYRLIFLMVAEDRDLLHPKDANEDARKLYADGYSLTALRIQCRRRTAWDKHYDRYEGIKIIFHALARGEKLLGLPSLGGLFAEELPPPPPPPGIHSPEFNQEISPYTPA